MKESSLFPGVHINIYKYKYLWKKKKANFILWGISITWWWRSKNTEKDKKGKGPKQVLGPFKDPKRRRKSMEMNGRKMPPRKGKKMSFEIYIYNVHMLSTLQINVQAVVYQTQNSLWFPFRAYISNKEFGRTSTFVDMYYSHLWLHVRNSTHSHGIKISTRMWEQCLLSVEINRIGVLIIHEAYIYKYI